MAKRSATTPEKPASGAKASASRPDGYPEVFRNFEGAMLEMERRMDRFLRDAWEKGFTWDFPLFHGLSLQPDAEGNAHITPFGNLGQNLKALREGWREPLMTWEVDDKKGLLHLKAEIPGVAKEDVDLEVTGDCIRLRAQSKDGSTRYQAVCQPGFEMQSDGAKARYEHGVLNLDVRLPASARIQGRKVKVEAV